MRKLIVLSFITLDGVMQAPGGPKEDPSEGFHFGGWQASYRPDELVIKTMLSEQLGHDFDLLLGRKTFDIFAGYWPKQTGSFADPLNKATKYVASHSPLKMDWKDTFRIEGDLAEGVRKLKSENGPELQVHGSSNMIQTLLKNDLVDELWLKIFPLTLGQGKRLFADGAIPAAFELTKCEATPKGVIIANYRRNGDVKTGTMGE
jgi:dihydrofolate reductase